MNRTLIAATLSCLPLVFAGCKNSDAAEKLPPAAGVVGLSVIPVMIKSGFDAGV